MNIINVVLKTAHKHIADEDIKILLEIINPKIILDEHIARNIRKYGIIVGHTEYDSKLLEESLLKFDSVQGVEFPEIKEIKS